MKAKKIYIANIEGVDIWADGILKYQYIVNINYNTRYIPVYIQTYINTYKRHIYICQVTEMLE